MVYRYACKTDLLKALLALLLALTLALGTGCAAPAQGDTPVADTPASQKSADSIVRPTTIAPRDFAETTQVKGMSAVVDNLAQVGAFDGTQPGCYVNGNIPQFTEDELDAAFGTEEYSDLDSLGRSTCAFALAGPETEPTAKRGSISAIHPSGWQQAQYPDLGLDHLYERSHLIAHCLTAEDANECNLMTGTNYMNQGAMQQLEQVMDRYIDSTAGHLLVKVSPVYTGNELVARGVHMQAYSLEDDGAAVCFNVYLHNVQPGIEIDYATGASRIETAELADTGETASADAEEVASANTEGTADSAEAAAAAAAAPASTAAGTHHEEPAGHHGHAAACSYVLNTNTHKFHHPSCASVKRMKDKNTSYMDATRDEVIAAGYSPCGNCNP